MFLSVPIYGCLYLKIDSVVYLFIYYYLIILNNDLNYYLFIIVWPIQKIPKQGIWWSQKSTTMSSPLEFCPFF